MQGGSPDTSGLLKRVGLLTGSVAGSGPDLLLPVPTLVSDLPSLIGRHVAEAVTQLPLTICRQLVVAPKVIANSCLLSGWQILKLLVTNTNGGSLVICQILPVIEAILGGSSLFGIHFCPAPRTLGKSCSSLSRQRLPTLYIGCQHFLLILRKAIPVRIIVLCHRVTEQQQQRRDYGYQVFSFHRPAPPLSLPVVQDRSP